MSEIIITRAGLADRTFIRSVSERTWPSTYGHIISQEQINFMMDWMYSDTSLATQMETGCEFYLASNKKENGELDAVGFCSVSPEKEEGENDIAHKLNKLYVLPKAQGTGAGKALLNKSIEVAKAAGSTSLFLQVNKLNTAYTFYLKKGFIKESEFKFDIGNGFYMDDYIMRLHF
ncbi:MAG: GNAT family N-acetyltransferase [Chitinophagia bacterium]|jgi:GNAT superfamily N-acetyltransferase